MRKVFVCLVLLASCVFAEDKDGSFYDYDSYEADFFKEADSANIDDLFKDNVEDDYQIEDNRSASDDSDALDDVANFQKGLDDEEEIPEDQDGIDSNLDIIANAENKESIDQNFDTIKSKENVDENIYSKELKSDDNIAIDEIEKNVDMSIKEENLQNSKNSEEAAAKSSQIIENKPQISSSENLGHDENVVKEELEEETDLSEEDPLEDLELHNILVEKNNHEEVIDKEPQIEEIISSGKVHMEKDNGESNSESKEISFDVNKDIEPLPLPPVASIDEIVKKASEEANENLNQDNDQAQELLYEPANNFDEKLESNEDFDDDINGDTIDEIYSELLDDLDKLSETREKLMKNDDAEENNGDDTLNPEDIVKFEEKYGEPYNEALVLSQRDSYDDMDENEDVPANNANQQVKDVINKDQLVNENGDADVDETGNQSNFDEDILEDISQGDDIPNDSSNKKSAESLTSDEIKESVYAQIAKPIQYIKDSISPNEENDVLKEQKSEILNDTPIKTMDVSEISPDQYEQLMQQFKIAHEDELESDVDNDSVNHIALDLDKAVVVTSPNYPDPYPTNVTIDWLFEGNGTGIEFNITDFAINGALGDYVLVKPGATDASGTDGLVFSYRLESLRKYRFLDVDRLFVRFVAHPGMAFLRGFQISVRMLSPLVPIEEPVPEPEPLIPEPRETLTLYLGIGNLTAFREMKEQFRIFLADMATMYINSNKIDPGLNTTYETTQITSVGVCNINWPGVHRCAELTFAVPLVYDEEEEEGAAGRLSSGELTDMWNTYSVVDPFAARLRELQVTEFMAPRDDNVLMLWILISLGVIFSTMVLAAMLWRYSCFENYTRLVSHSDTSSEYSGKSAPALYPTPHQALPPLPLHGFDGYDAADYMGGFTNKSFRRDELFDIESDEDDYPRRNTKMTPRDVSDV